MIDSKLITDQEITKLVLDGEKPMYEIIVKRYNQYLYQVGRSYGYNHHDTMDLMQDSYVDAYIKLDQFEGRANFKTWLVRIMLNNCYDKKQKFSYQKEITMTTEQEKSVLGNLQSSDNTETIINKKELGQIIEKALSKIALKYRMVFSLREIEGLNVAETAHALQISKSNVKVRLSRAKTMLKKELGQEYTPQELYHFNLLFCDKVTKNVMNRIEKL